MSLDKLNSAVERLRETATQAAWRQWAAIFTLASVERPAQSMVDPEALIVFSMSVADYEPRAWHAAHVWSTVAPRLLSVQRTKNILKLFPSDVTPRVRRFAHSAVVRGGDARWRHLISDHRVQEPRPRTEAASPRFASQAAIMLRLRLALGIGIKSDVLSYLIGCMGGSATVKQTTDATRYYGRAVRRAVEELAAGGFIRARTSAPASYSVDLGAWATLLDLDVNNPPAWRQWSTTYAFVASTIEWLATRPPKSEIVAASEARDLMAAWTPRVDLLAAREPLPGRHPGAAFLDYFVDDIIEPSIDYIESVA